MSEIIAKAQNSPFSGGVDWSLEYTILPKNHKGIFKIWEEGNRERDKKLAGIINSCKFLTGIQVSKASLWTGGIGTAKKRLNYLSRGYYLVKHVIKLRNMVLPIYTVGPAAFIEDLSNKTYINNFYREYTLLEVLKILSCNQLFVRLTDIAHTRIKFDGVLPPYTAEIEFVHKKYGNPYDNYDKITTIPIISLRNYPSELEELKRQLPKFNKRALIIAYSLEALDELLPELNKNEDTYRFTYDDALFRMDLSEAFYKLKGNALIKTLNDVF